jgi:tetraacyldisaccharide 4'-kinase
VKAPRFWWSTTSPIGFALAPFGWLYGFLSAHRMQRHGTRVNRPIICIGNLVAGGAGKTPTAIMIARRLQARGYHPVFLTRGYGGALAGPVRVDLAHHSASEIGDEAPLLARYAPTIVSRDRVQGAEFAARHGDVIVMDDGMQNPSLEKDCTLVVIDSVQGIGNGRVIPAGPLRAPLGVQMNQADFCLVIGDERRDVPSISQYSKLIFHGHLQPDPAQIATHRNKRVYAFAGIGRPEKFFTTLTHAGVDVAKTQSFPDHHPYTRATLEDLLAEAGRKNLTPMTTAKDAVRIHAIAPDLANRFSVLDVELVCDDADALISSVIAKIEQKQPKST